jgi:hypothetical protein
MSNLSSTTFHTAPNDKLKVSAIKFDSFTALRIEVSDVHGYVGQSISFFIDDEQLAAFHTQVEMLELDEPVNA